MQTTWPITLLGVPFDPMTLTAAVEQIQTMITSRRPHYIVTPNVDFLVQARRDDELHQILTLADLVLCDGKPLIWASRWLGNTLPDRVAGADLVPILLKRAAERRWRVFLLGGGPGVAREAARRIASEHPTLPPVAHYSPPYAPLEAMNHDEIFRQVQAAQPDIVLVCFGCPKQEKWIFRHYKTLGVPVLIGAGGTVDFLAGRLKRAPRWMRHAGGEWLFRLCQEPRRLATRYAGDFFHFFPALLAQRLRLPPATETAAKEGAAACVTTFYGIKVEACQRFHCDTLQRAPLFWSRAVEQPGHCVIDLAPVKSIDSTGLAFLAHWQKRRAQSGRNLILFRPSSAVRRALSRARLLNHFVITESISAP